MFAPIPSSSGFSRRSFLKTGTVAVGGLALGTAVWPSLGATDGKAATLPVSDLPKGSAPKPVSFPHFPSRLHAFVWRNWPLVTPERMARVVGAKRADIVRLGRAMGLGQSPRITRDQQARSYLTVIKRNWHLLPYEQLLALLDWTPDAAVQRLVSTWPGNVDFARAAGLGLRADESFEAVVCDYIRENPQAVRIALP